VAMTIITFVSKASHSAGKITCLMVQSILTFTVGVIVVGISIGKADYWDKDLFGSDGARFPLLFLGVIILCYIVFIFILIRAKEVIRKLISDGLLTEDEPRTLNDFVCGSLYDNTGSGGFVRDDQFDRKKKPSFQNKNKAPRGVKRRTEDSHSSSFDGGSSSEDEPLVKQPVPVRNMVTTNRSAPTYAQISTRATEARSIGAPAYTQISTRATEARSIGAPTYTQRSTQAVPGGSSGHTYLQNSVAHGPISPRGTKGIPEVSPRIGGMGAGVPRQYVQTPSILGSDNDSSLSPRVPRARRNMN
jgi:hypothetical protein